MSRHIIVCKSYKEREYTDTILKEIGVNYIGGQITIDPEEVSYFLVDTDQKIYFTKATRGDTKEDLSDLNVLQSMMLSIDQFVRKIKLERINSLQ